MQKWFDGLEEVDRFEIVDQLIWLSNQIHRQWGRPHFDPLKGEGGISEIIIPDIRTEKGTTYYRIYGFFGPKEYKHSYTFLHAVDKKARNDKHGKSIARDRFHNLERREATVHELNFARGSDSKVDEGTGSKSQIC